MRPVPRLLAAAALATLSAGAPARADTGDLESLLNETVVTTASSAAETASTAPASSVTVSAEELRTFGIRSLDEAIDYLALGLVTSDPLRTADIGARGVLLRNDAGKHFLLLVNGHALNDPLYGAARFDHGSGVPLEIIDRIEVIVGPGSVLYGSNAMLGVINVITKDATHFKGGHVLGEYEPGASYRAGAGAGFQLSLWGKPVGVTAYATHFERFGPDLDFDLQPFAPSQTGTGPENFGPKAVPGRWGGTLEDAYFASATSAIVRATSRGFELNLLASRYKRGIPYTTEFAWIDWDETSNYERDRALRFDLKHTGNLSARLQLTSRVYADTFDYQQQVDRAAAIGCRQSDFETCRLYSAGVARWVGGELRLAMNWLEDSSLTTLLGIDGRMRWVNSKDDAIDAATGEPFAPTVGIIDESGALVSPYLQQTWQPADWLGLNAGARLDYDPRFDPIVSPRLAAAVTPFDGTTVKGIYSQAFRAPSWSETGTTERRRVASPDLHPEIVRSLEGSIEQRFSTQRLSFGVFRTWWHDLVELRILSAAEIAEIGQPTTAFLQGFSRYGNVSDLENYGYNGTFSGSLVEGRLRYGLNATAAYTRRQVNGQARPLPLAPQVFGNARVAYAFGGDLPTPALAAQYIGKRAGAPVHADGSVATDYTPEQVELRGTLSGRVPGVRGLSYRLSATYNTASNGPYLVGMRPYGAELQGRVYTNPVDQFTGFAGLQYDFFGEDAAYEGAE